MTALDSEFYLRLLVEEVVAAGTDDHHVVTSGLRDLAMASRALRAAGGVSEDTAAEVVAEAELALFVRGATWLEHVMTDLPALPVPGAGDRGDLVSVLTVGDTLVEVWTQSLTVRTAGGEWWTTPGGLPHGHDRLEVRTTGGVVSLDLSRGATATDVAPAVRPLGPIDALLAWASIAEPALLARSSGLGDSQFAQEPFETIARRAPGVTVTAIEGGTRVHAALARSPAAAWLVSPEGVHALDEELRASSPVPAPPGALTLVLVDDGAVTELALRS